MGPRTPDDRLPTDQDRVGGIAVLAIGIWTVVDKKFLENLVDVSLFFSAAYIEIGAGVVAVFIAFLGCFGALKEVRCMLLTYSLLLFLLFVVVLIAGILGYVFKMKIEDQIKIGLDNALTEYDPKVPGYVTEGWNNMQRKLKCCGVESYTDWSKNRKGITGTYPDSCCAPGLSTSEISTCKSNAATSNNFYRDPCLTTAKAYLKQHGSIIGGVGISIAVIMNGVECSESAVASLGPNFILLPQTQQLKALHTVIRDKSTVRSDFVFYADRLIRLVVEEGLNQLPFKSCSVVTPTGTVYDGCRFERGNCGVSIVRSGEAMEKGLRSCCRSIRIGKILVESDETHNARVVYAKFPGDIAFRKALLMYPILSTGNTVIKAVEVLREHNVPEENIILLNLFCTPVAARSVLEAFPKLKLLSSEMHPFTPNNFGQRYFVGAHD
ncbi:unnamed protein product [Notodromas monacha]|uniref:Uracil phosphoribosyltransferase homolog n=1 Tax=Notodromas monacha TaxID=399045 RepID=A0A7R9BS13_9CRUS|nr:unnamed protein product [Notodromas monacha]CAG0919707.1 unnamed protein product [Notodromas monacha]